MDKIWLKSYPANVKHEIDPNEYSSLTDLLTRAFQQHGDNPFSVCMERWMSYRELDQLSQALGAWFQAQGLPAGSRIALMLPNLPQFSVTMAAVLRAGALAGALARACVTTGVVAGAAADASLGWCARMKALTTG